MPIFINEKILRLQISVGDVWRMEVLERQNDLNCEKKCNIVCKSTLSSKEREQFSTTSIVKKHENVGWRLKCAFKVYNEGVINPLEDWFLTLNMFYLFQSNYFTFLQAFQSQRERLFRVVSMLYKPDSTEGTRPQRRDEVEVI